MSVEQLKDVKAVIFDVFGTVVDWRTGVSREAAAFLTRHNRQDINPDDFADCWRDFYAPAMAEVNSGRRPFVRLDILHRENLDKVLEKLGIDAAAIPHSELDELNRAWHRLDPWPDSVQGIQRLKKRFIVAPLSNGNIILMINMAKRAGLPWDAILGAEVAGIYKPMPEAYLRTADILAMRPEEICLVAAHNDDLAAARKCGLRTAFVLRPTDHGPNQKTDLCPTQEWDVIADTIDDLAAKLGT
ncbi:haloacid dehalogenase type II [Phyllobacterium sp. YR531]|uniref:haloacid dehalogenase type II n=1 Tax=Phyllobacterium sp. YR531 TaxID=1144343 RepID=UPI00026FB21E|nr:haloacid dehalogenase type II [Phyllobacterium sp. YR531]EJN05470.1 2-haloalkanoic acid dehalogenase, type II [Phyllobacterium sp. YR531]